MKTQIDRDTAYASPAAPGVAVLTMNRPDHANGVTVELAQDMLEIVRLLEQDPAVRVVVLTGAGAQFSAGADLKRMQDYLENDLQRVQEPFNAQALYPLTRAVADSPLAFVAAINGGATAGGLDLAMACDLRVASTTAKLGETYIRIGMVPGNGGGYFLPRLVGSGFAAELALTGDVIGAERALQIGLVNYVVPPEELIDAAVTLSARIARNPGRAISATRQVLRNGWRMDLNTALETGYWTVAAMTYTSDLKEGVSAFLEKRAPRFEGDPDGAATEGGE